MKLPNINLSADSLPKIGHDFSIKRVQKIEVIKKNLTKNVLLLGFFIEKKIRKLRMIFDIENSLSQNTLFSFEYS